MAAALTCAPPPSTPVVRSVDVGALLALRDVSGLSLSPDGRSIAYQLQQADLSTNTYHSVWCVAPLDRSGPPRTVGDGGDIVMPLLSGLGRPTGLWNTLAPRWRPDGNAIAFVARRNNETQIEVCTLADTVCRIATHSAGDVRDLVWTSDGAALIYESRPSREDARASLQAEGEAGFHVDDRFDVFHSLTPLRTAAAQVDTISRVDLSSGEERSASTDERTLFQRERRATLSTSMGAARSSSLFSDAPVPLPDVLVARDARDFIRVGVQFMWTAPADARHAGADPPLTLFSGAPDQQVTRCGSSQCVGRIVEMAATPDASQVLFIKREGWDFSQHGLYLWDLARNETRRILLGDDVIRVCWPRRDDAICLREGPTQPRQIVRIDFATGRVHVIVDPNANIPRSAFAPARKLEWRTPRGDDVFGYLVTPPGITPRRLPLIVVQYRASGFLRGGVGDEYPVQAFAHRGFAVLVLERPDPTALLASTSDATLIDQSEWRDLNERWRTMAALTSGIDLLARGSLIDTARVGVTGLSDGAETTVFALIHCRCIAAVAISSGVHDPISYYFSTDAERAEMRDSGRGDEVGAQGATWSALSLARNAQSVSAPILAQPADREAVFMLQTARTFADLGKPFDLYIFPNEYHVKWQPRHRQAIYQRSLDWFAFWLLDETDPDPAKADEYARWSQWRAARAPHS